MSSIVPIPDQTLPSFGRGNILTVTVRVNDVIQPDAARAVTARVTFEGETVTDDFLVTSQAVKTPTLAFDPDGSFDVIGLPAVRVSDTEWDLSAQLVTR